MRSLNTKKYAKYYILLEVCIKYYNDYQILLKEKYNWSWKIFMIFFVAAIIPGGTIWAEKRLIEGKKYKEQLAEKEIK